MYMSLEIDGRRGHLLDVKNVGCQYTGNEAQVSYVKSVGLKKSSDPNVLTVVFEVNKNSEAMFSYILNWFNLITVKNPNEPIDPFARRVKVIQYLNNETQRSTLLEAVNAFPSAWRCVEFGGGDKLVVEVDISYLFLKMNGEV